MSTTVQARQTWVRTLGQLLDVLGTRVLSQQLNCNRQLFIDSQQFYEERPRVAALAMQQPAVQHGPTATV